MPFSLKQMVQQIFSFIFTFHHSFWFNPKLVNGNTGHSCYACFLKGLRYDTTGAHAKKG